MSNNTQQEQQQQSHHKYTPKMKVESIEEIKDQDKTQLQREYTIWVKQGKQQVQQSYENVVKPVSTFKTVEDFWALYSHFKRPTQMHFGTVIYFFADGVRPLWEDKECQDGGKFNIKIPKTHTNKFWEDLVLALIGEQFTHENEVIGLGLLLKPNFDTIQIWNRSGKDEAKLQALKEDILRLIKIDEETMKINYDNFQEIISTPQTEQPKEKEGGFTRNIGGDQEGNQNGDQKFEKRQISRGGGFSRGRGRGRGQQQ